MEHCPDRLEKPLGVLEVTSAQDSFEQLTAYSVPERFWNGHEGVVGVVDLAEAGGSARGGLEGWTDADA